MLDDWGFGVLTQTAIFALQKRQAVNVLNYEASLPVLPSNMPGPMYYAPRANTYAFSLQACYTATISERG